jgi:hypothetical protein
VRECLKGYPNLRQQPALSTKARITYNLLK